MVEENKAYVSEIDEWPDIEMELLRHRGEPVRIPAGSILIFSSGPGEGNWWDRQLKNGGMPKREGFKPWYTAADKD